MVGKKDDATERTRAENEVARTAPGGVAGATETVHGGRERSRCGGLRETALSSPASARASMSSPFSNRSGSNKRDDEGGERRYRSERRACVRRERLDERLERE